MPIFSTFKQFRPILPLYNGFSWSRDRGPGDLDYLEDLWMTNALGNININLYN